METGKDPGTLLKVLKVQGRASSIKKLAVSNGRGHGAEHKEKSIGHTRTFGVWSTVEDQGLNEGQPPFPVII